MTGKSYAQSKDLTKTISDHYRKGIHYQKNTQYDSALYHFHTIEQQVEHIPTSQKQLPHQGVEDIKQTYRWLAQIYGDQSEFERAIQYAEKSLKVSVLQEGENAPGLYWHYHQLADLFKYGGQYTKSVEYYQRAIYLLDQESIEEPLLSQLDSAKAALFSSLGHAAYVCKLDREVILDYFNTSLKYSEGQSTLIPLRVHCLLGMARFFTASKSFDEALVVLNRADSLWDINHTRFLEHPDYYNIKRKLIRHRGYYWKKQEYYQKAIAYYKQYLNISDQHIKKPREFLYLLTTFEIGEIYYDAFQYREDRPSGDSSIYYLQKCLINISDNYNSYDLETLPTLEDINNHTFAFDVLQLLARFNQKVKTSSGDPEAHLKGLKTATAIIELADQLFDEALKNSISLKGYINELLFKKSILIYDVSLIFNHYLYQIEPSEDLLEKAFYYVQKMKAQQIWLDQLKEEAIQNAQLPDSIIQKEKSFLKEIQSLESQLYLAELNKEKAAIAKLKNETLFNSKRKYEAFQKLVDQTYPSFHSSKFNFKPKTIEQLRARLNDDEVILDYAGSSNFEYVFAISKNGPPAFEQLSFSEEDANEIRAAITELNDLLQRSPMHRKSSRTNFIQLSHYLYQRYLEPIAAHIKDKKRVIIIGDGLTNYIPFEVLLSTNEEKPFSDLNYLVKQHEVSYHYSTTLLAKSREQKPPHFQKGIYTFAPVYDQIQTPTIALNDTQDSNPNTALRAFNKKGELVPLPESEGEVNAILQLFEAQFPNHNKRVLREEATKEALKNSLEEPYQFIHIAGHSFADLNDPLFSGIACFKDNDTQNAMLYTGEIYLLKPQADLVTLSSCESGFGQVLESDGLVGLNRAFVLAGTPNVVFSLWKVYDKVSAKMMAQFYTQILAGQDYSGSLRHVKLRMIEDPVTASPHYWSSFLLLGR